MSSHLSWKKYVAPVQKEIYKIQTAKIREGCWFFFQCLMNYLKKEKKEEKGTLVALEFQYIIPFKFSISNQTVM